MSVILTENQSFFDQSPYQPSESVIASQVDVSKPEITGLLLGSSLLLPDRNTRNRLDHFPAEVYDLSDNSHLMRFMRALMGETGAGWLRKKYTIAQLQNTLESARYYDLDRFYGAIFGATRFSNEVLRQDPAFDVYTPQEWDEIDQRDDRYRARIIRLAKAINLGATIPGLQAAAEALMQQDCEIYETWSLLDTYGSLEGSTAKTWAEVEVAFPTWDDIEGETFDVINGAISIGRTGVPTRSEIIVRTHKDYEGIANTDGQAEADRQKAEDSNALLRVLRVLKPAGVLLTVDHASTYTRDAVPVAGAHADSNFWRVVQTVTPGATSEGYVLSQPQQDRGITPADPHVVPEPPMVNTQGREVSLNSLITSAEAQVLTSAEAPHFAWNYSDYGLADVNQFNRQQTLGSDIVVGRRGQTISIYPPQNAVMNSTDATSTLLSADGSIVAHPYAEGRIEVAQ